MRYQVIVNLLHRRLSLNRAGSHLLFAAVLWPLLTILGTILSLLRLPYYDVPIEQALAAAFAGLALSLGDMFASGAIFFGLSWALFRRFGRSEESGRFPAARLATEPLLMFAAVICGVSLWYPAVLSEPLFSPFGDVPAAVLVALLAASVAVGAGITGRPGARLRLAALLLAVGVVSPTAGFTRAALEGAWGEPPSVVVLGIDSLSQSDGLSSFREWVEAESGTWYERAVTPGLLTNAVWTSILTMEPVRTHGVFHTFQHFPEGDAAAFLAAAGARGYRTVSYFPDQSTCAVGSQAGFDQDRSGPVGWRQVLLPIVANSSFLVPVVRPALPRVWPSPSAVNQAGSFTYDVRRDIRAILSAGVTGRQTLVAAHLTYVHLPAYPRSADLSWAELRRIALAPAQFIRDRGFDWQDLELPTDPVPLRKWKLTYLRRTIESELRATRYLANGGQLVVFSDHGHRVGLTLENFADARYYHVLLATFGVTARRQGESVSLIDIGSLLGFSDGRAEPAVEFALAPSAIWPTLVNSARLRWSGAVDLHAGPLAQISKDLRRHVPWPGVKGAVPPTDITSSFKSMMPQ